MPCDQNNRGSILRSDSESDDQRRSLALRLAFTSEADPSRRTYAVATPMTVQHDHGPNPGIGELEESDRMEHASTKQRDSLRKATCQTEYERYRTLQTYERPKRMT